jgi:hypothetical protein
MMSHDQIFELLPLHALDALEGDEMAEVERHVASCDVCSAELALNRSVTSTFIADSPPPLGGWGRIAGEIEATGETEEVISLDAGRERRRPAAFWLASMAAALALVFAGLALVQRQTINDLSGPDGVIAAAEAAAGEPGAIVADFETEGGAVAEVVLTGDGDGFILPTDTLDALGPDRTYQLWVITPDEQVISAGVLGSDPGPARFTWTGEVAGFALTREPAGGVVSSEGDVVSVIET